MKTKKFVFFFVFLIAVLVFDQVQSYSAPGYKWPTGEFSFYINPENGDMGPDKIIPAIKRGANVWRNWCVAKYAGTTVNQVAKKDGVNNVFFRSDAYGALASTYVFKKDGVILDVDIIFWDNPWKFYSGRTGCNNGFYVADVATHEFGHAIGLRHSRVKEASMYKNCDWCSKTVRTLAIDDKDAAASLYGTGTLTSMIVNQE